MTGLFAFLWLTVMIAIGARQMLKRVLLRALARRYAGRTIRLTVRVTPRLGLRAFGLRLRLYGVVLFDDAARRREATQALVVAVDRRRVRLRIVGRDADGTLVAVVRFQGSNASLSLLRTGLVAAPVSAARAYREAMTWARCRGRGHWREVDKWPPGFVGWQVERTPAMTYRYG